MFSLSMDSASDAYAFTRRTVYSLNFILAAVAALSTYFITPLLIARGVPENQVGLIYSIAAAVSILALFAAPRIFSQLGNYRAMLVLGTISSIALITLAFIKGYGGVAALFVFWSATMALVYLLLDILLEGSMPNEGTTGGSRGLFISLGNAAWFMFPVIAGYLAAFGSFELLFSVAALCSILGIGLAAVYLPDIRHHAYKPLELGKSVRRVLRHPDLRLVFSAQLLLRIFYALMVIYTPIYLLTKQHVSLADLGSIISVAMIAFLIFEWPAGRLADAVWGEKELMAVGFVIMAAATLLFAYADGPTILVFGGVLFLTRIGASLVDITTESYFFKQVTGSDADLVSMFRMLGPLAYIIGPLAASLILSAYSLPTVFIVLAGLLLFGVPLALFIHDSR